jgi:superfamily II DNA or RNA helicase
MRYELRPYQAAAIDQLRANIRAGVRRQILMAPTGAGKTVTFAHLIESAAQRGKYCHVWAHRKELVEQCSEKLFSLGVEHGIIRANDPRRRPWAGVHVATVQTLRNREIKRDPDLIIIDECHLSISKTWRELIARFPRAVVIGATATPGRPDGKAMGLIYQRIVPGPSIRTLTASGYLVPVRYFVYQRPAEMGDVKTVRGDYDQSAMAAIFEKSTIVGDIVDHWMRLARQKKTILFAASIKASLEMVEKFRRLGVRAEHLDGKTPDGERSAILKRLKSGETQILSNVGVMDEGVDEPSVECIDLGSSTKSIVKYLQRIGRGLRPFDNKRDCMVLDHGGCIYDNGRYDDDREWSLDGRKREQGPKIDTEESFKVCPACEQVCAKYQLRCECGYKFSAVERKPQEIDGELEEVGEGFIVKPKFTIRKPSKDPAVYQLQKIAQQNGYKPGWMWMQRNKLMAARAEYRSVFGDEPPAAWDLPQLYREISEARRYQAS